MAMTIAPIGAVGSLTSAPLLRAGGASTGSGSDFATWLGDALDKVSGSQANADGLAVQAATGDLAAIHDFTIAATEAQLLTQLTVEVRNRAVEAFNDIMRMQV
jgi:flagellar hook-basal body complex protein FliE